MKFAWTGEKITRPVAGSYTAPPKQCSQLAMVTLHEKELVAALKRPTQFDILGGKTMRLPIATPPSNLLSMVSVLEISTQAKAFVAELNVPTHSANDGVKTTRSFAARVAPENFWSLVMVPLMSTQSNGAVRESGGCGGGEGGVGGGVGGGDGGGGDGGGEGGGSGGGEGGYTP